MVTLRRLVRRARSPEERREEVAVPAGSNAYNSLWQVRTDAWSALEESTAQLAPAGAEQRPVEQAYFVTNGTPTANKIVVQALVQPAGTASTSPDAP
jgi:phosphoribosylformylglycinamidine (FGAM) synthase-like enzyme